MENNDVCVWEWAENSPIQVQCSPDMIFIMPDDCDRAKDIGYKFCPYCGEPIVEKGEDDNK